jgi:hypothetical protein
MTLRKWIAAIVLVLDSSVAVGAFAAEADQEQEDSTAGIVDPIQKGSKELALLGAVAIAHEIWDGVGDIHYLVLGARIGKVLSTPRGPGFLRGNLEISGELLPVFQVYQGDSTYGFSATLLFRHFLSPGARWRPYVALGIGALGTADKVPKGFAHLNFTPQIGLGLAYSHSERFTFYFDYRLHHTSNGGRVAPNPGINSSMMQVSVSIFRW